MYHLVPTRVTQSEEGDGHTLATGASGTADAVRVVLNVVGHVVVDDQRHVRHVDTAARHVRRDEAVVRAVPVRQQYDGGWADGWQVWIIRGFYGRQQRRPTLPSRSMPAQLLSRW